MTVTQHEAPAQLAARIGQALEAVRTAAPCDCGRRRDDVVRLVHRWAAQQERDDAAQAVRTLDAWAAQLNAAVRCGGGGARPVVRVGMRLCSP